MAIKGAVAKQEVANKILETFANSFQYDKEIRIPMYEDGNLIQIKCVLTAAKVAVSPDGEMAIPGAVNTPVEKSAWETETVITPAATAPRDISEEEKQNIESLLRKLNF